MKMMNCAALWFALPIVIPVGIAAAQPKSAPANHAVANGIEWSVARPAGSFMAGEPVPLAFTMTNRADNEQRIDFGWEGIGAFRFALFDSAGTTVSAAGPIPAQEGLGVGDNRTLKPGAAESKAVVLNRWCSTLIPPGAYRVRCWISPVFLHSNDASRGVANASSIATYAPPVELETEIAIIQRDRAAMTARMDRLESQAAEARSKRVEGNGDAYFALLRARRHAVDMIAYAEGPEAAPYQLRLLRDWRAMFDTWSVVCLIRDRLAKAASAQVASELVRIYNEAPFGDTMTQPEINYAIYRLRDSGNPEILAATKEFADKHARSGDVIGNR